MPAPGSLWPLAIVDMVLVDLTRSQTTTSQPGAANAIWV